VINDENASRRTLIKLLSAGAVAVLAGGRVLTASAAAALVPLTSADPSAKALGYVDESSTVDNAAHPTHKPTQKCSTCVQYQGKAGDARAACNIYPGKSVAAGGWCTVWAQKPGA
jgi:hypothetical protein